MGEDPPEEPRRLNEDMARAAVAFLRAVIARRPPFAAVLTVWASMIAPEGCGGRPIWVRTRSRRCSWIRPQVPS
jgi:hypothetical protein